MEQANAEDIQLNGALIPNELENLMLPFVSKQFSHPTQTVRRSISMLWNDDPLDQVSADVHSTVALETQRSASNGTSAPRQANGSSALRCNGLPPGLTANGDQHTGLISGAQQHHGLGGGAQQQHTGLSGSGQQAHHPWQPLISTWSSPPLDAHPPPSAAVPFGKLSAAELEKENRKALATEMLQQMLHPLSIGQEVSRELSFGLGGMCVRKTIDHLFEDESGTLTSG